MRSRFAEFVATDRVHLVDRVTGERREFPFAVYSRMTADAIDRHEVYLETAAAVRAEDRIKAGRISIN